MEKKLTVTKEHLPQRCEICHQTDLFVATTGECKRCKDTAKKFIESVNNARRQIDERNRLLLNAQSKKMAILYGAMLVMVLLYFSFLEPLHNLFSETIGKSLAGLLVAAIWLVLGSLGIWLIDQTRKY